MKQITFCMALLTSASAFAAGSLDSDLRKLLPSERISVRNVNSNIALHGTVSTPEVAKKAIEIATQYVDADHEVINMLKLKSSNQVMLKVKFGELSKKTYNNLASKCANNSVALTSCLNDLSSKGVFKSYSEPSLVAASGETAYFASGGEIAVANYDAESKKQMSYKPYGVKLSFTPRVIASDSIRVAVDYEISKPVKSSMHLPEFATSHATTTVELAPGETYMIAGIVSDDSHKLISDSGPLGFLSHIFPSSSYEQKEVVVSITPYFVNSAEPTAIKLPAEDSDVDTELDAMLKSRLKSSSSKVILD